MGTIGNFKLVNGVITFLDYNKNAMDDKIDPSDFCTDYPNPYNINKISSTIHNYYHPKKKTVKAGK